MKKNILPSIVLGAICLVVALLLSVVNMLTAPIIADRQNAAADAALLEVLPGCTNAKPVELTADYPAIITKGYKANNGCVFQMELTGKSSGLIIMVGVSSEGKVTGTKVIANQETPSYAEKVFPNLEGTSGKYTDMTLDGFEPQLVAGATLTSRAYSEAVKAALHAAVLASGGSVDTRTEEEKHSDACNLALGTTGKTFERWFMTETLAGVSNVYTCDEGIVLIIGDEYVGFNNAGAIVKSATKDSKTASDVSAETKAKAEAAYAIYSLTLATDYRTEVARPSKASKRVTKIELTSTGNYIMYMEAAGNGKNGEEYAHPTDRYIEFMVCISADGVIIDVMTTSRGTESEGFGDVCETDAYTEQFRGATVDNIVMTEEGTSSTSTDLGIIAGATVTSNGYQQALQRAFNAFSLLTESN